MSSPIPTTTTTTSYFWCYSCSRFIIPTSPSCPNCRRRFLEPISNPFNPIIVLRRSTTTFDLFYNSGNSLHPLPRSVSEFVMGSAFDHLLDQLSQMESAKAAFESLPTIKMTDCDVTDVCAVCMEGMGIGDDVKEMPCKHLFHRDCVLPWLGLRRSCPVCKRELGGRREEGLFGSGGVAIWRLPGGGFAVGRFSGRLRGGGVVGRMVHGFFGLFRCFSAAASLNSGG